MTEAHSSISSSEHQPLSRLKLSSIFWFVAGVFVVAGCFEGIVANMFSIPPNAQEPSGSLERFFNYGLSIEAKLDRSVGNNNQEPTAIVRAGWISTELYPPSENWESASQRVVFYGMSFTNRIAKQMRELDSPPAISTRAGPGAPLSHSFALFGADPWRTQADVVIVGILSSSIPYLQGFTGLGYTPENPAPHTFPMYTFVEGQLERFDPPIMQRDQFVEAYRTQSDLWKEHRKAMSEHDVHWDPFVFNRSILDRSALVRLLRRAWASRNVDLVAQEVYSSKDGYDIDNPSIAAVPEILRRMHEECTSAGQEFIVILLHARGEPGHLHAWLNDQLANDEIGVLSTIDLFSSVDQLNFEGSGHYKPHLDKVIAEKLLEMIVGTNSDDD